MNNEDQDTTAPVTENEELEASVEVEDEDVVVSIGEAPAPADDPATAPAAEWVRELRKTNRELQRQNRELQGKLTTSAQPAPPTPALGAKPKLEDHDYDADKYEEALGAWFERKRASDDASTKQQAETAGAQREWQSKLDGYSKAKAELKVKDFEDAEAVAQELFSVTQQGVMLQGADNPALLVYALGKNPTKSKELAAIKDPVKFAFAIAKLEKDLKVTNRTPAPPPEKVVTGTGRSSGAVDSTLERLRAEAQRTGDMTKVIRYKSGKK